MAKKKRGWMQGTFTPKNPEKYVGNVSQIIYRSSWELSFNKFLDSNPNIIAWNSEELAIPYKHPFKNKMARYYPDYWVKYKTKDGTIKAEVIEVKPKNQVNKPRGGNKYDQMRWIVNMEKWKAARMFCDKNNVAFRILTENSLFL